MTPPYFPSQQWFQWQHKNITLNFQFFNDCKRAEFSIGSLNLLKEVMKLSMLGLWNKKLKEKENDIFREATSLS